MTIRPKSALGLKFLQVTPGNSSKGFAAGETIPLKAYTPEPVDIDEFFDMFDEPTRLAIRQNLAGFGNALAGRGPQLNEAIGALRRFVVNGQPALRTIVAPSTNFAGFWRALENLSATVAPVAETNASLFVALDRTFAAFARVSRPYIQETIEKGPPTLGRGQRRPAGRAPLLPRLRSLLHRAEAGCQGARGNLAGHRRSPTRRGAGAERLAGPQQPAAADGPGAGRLPECSWGLQRPRPADRHQRIVEAGAEVHRPGADQCNYVSLAFQNLALSTGGGNDDGNWLNFISFTPPEGPNSEGGPSSAPANGPGEAYRANHLHFNPYPNTGAPGQPNGCEAGNEKYAAGKTVIGEAPGLGHDDAGDRNRMSRLPERDTRQGANKNGRFSWRPSNAAIAIIFILIFTIGPYLAFTKHVPFTSYGYELNATFANSANIAKNSPVRIAGVEVGKVISTERDGNATTVTFTVDGAGRPIHDDAFAAIRPRIFLEGNFFVELDPGSPSAPDLDSGGTIPVSHTSTAVQIDEVLIGAAVADAGRPQSPARELRHRAHPQADGGRRRHPAARGPRQDRRRSPQRRPQIRRRRRPLQRPGHQRPPRHPAARSRAPGRRRRPHLRRPCQPRGRPAGADRQLQRLHRRPRHPVEQPLDHGQPAGADPEDRPRLAGQPQPHAAAAAHLRDRADPGGGRAAGPDQRLETVAWPGPPAALRQRGRWRRQAARRIDAGPGRRGSGGQGNGAAAAQPAQPLHDSGAGADLRTRRSTTASAPAGRTTASSSTTSPTSPARARTSTATAPTSASRVVAAPSWLGLRAGRQPGTDQRPDQLRPHCRRADRHPATARRHAAD